MKVVDERYRMLGFLPVLGDEVIRFSAAETVVLRRALRVLEQARDLRRAEYARRWHMNDDEAGDLADDSDSLTLAAAFAYLDELLDSTTTGRDQLVRIILPEPAGTVGATKLDGGVA